MLKSEREHETETELRSVRVESKEEESMLLLSRVALTII